jgi:hypothetical protein
VSGAEDNIGIVDTREYTDLPGVCDHGMLNTVTIQSTWETLIALYTEKVRRTSDNKARKPKAIRESDCCIVPKKQGNSCGGKAATQHQPQKRNISYTQR